MTMDTTRALRIVPDFSLIQRQWLEAVAPFKPWRAVSAAEMGRGKVDSAE
jgi:hypothetical protein